MTPQELALAAAREIRSPSAHWRCHSLSAHAEREIADIILKHFAAQQEEIERLTDIIRREAWLEHADNTGKSNPYVPWDEYIKVQKERDQLALDNQKLRTELQELSRKAKALDWYCTADPEYSINQLSNGKWLCYHYKTEPLEASQHNSALEAIEAAMSKTNEEKK